MKANSFIKFILLTLFLLTAVLVVDAQTHGKILVPYRSGNFWGYSDTLRNINIKPKYDSAGLFTDKTPKIAIVYKKRKVNIITTEGKTLLSNYYDSMYSRANDRFYVFLKGKKTGLYDAAKNKIILRPEFDQVEFGDGEFIVTKKGISGVMSNEGRWLTEIKYNRLYFNDEHNWLGEISGKQYLIDKATGKSKLVVDGEGLVYAIEGDGGVEEQHQLTQEVIDDIKKRKELDSVGSVPFGNYRTNVYVYRTFKDKKVGLYFRDHGTFIGPVYDKITELQSVKKTIYIIVSVDGKFGLIDRVQDVVIPLKYDSLFHLSYSLVYTQLAGKQGVWMFNTIYPPIAPKYETIKYFDSLPVTKHWAFILFRVKKDGKWGYVGENGEEYFD